MKDLIYVTKSDMACYVLGNFASVDDMDLYILLENLRDNYEGQGDNYLICKCILERVCQ